MNYALLIITNTSLTINNLGGFKPILVVAFNINYFIYNLC